MKLLLNEDIPLTSAEILKDAGFNVRHLAGRSSGKSDQDVIQLAYKDKRTFVTFDKDSCDQFLRDGFTFPGGIVVFDLPEFDEQFPAKMLVKINKGMGLEIKGFYTIVKKNVINRRAF